jgi:putative transposase
MSKSNEMRHGRHCVFNLHVHLVFVAKYRRRLFRKEHYETMKGIFSSVCDDFGASLIEVDGENDHVHLLIAYPPVTPVSKLVNSLKGVSSRLLKSTYPDLRRHYWKGALWSPSYFAASCGGAPIDIIKQYIEQQDFPS